MLDFLMISTRSTKRGVIEIYPKFIIKKSSDLMIRGGDFYAIWNEEIGLWSTEEQDALQLIDKELDTYIEKHHGQYASDVKGLHMWDAETGMVDIWHKYCQKQMRDYFHMLDEELIFSNHQTVKEDYASKTLSYPLVFGDCSSYDRLMSVLYSDEERHKIEWAIGAVIHGDSKTLQKFVVLYGAAGTGKSTILNIIQQLFHGYYSVFDAKALGSTSNVFALESFRSNPLVSIQHDGDLSKIEDNTRLNSLVSHELMTVNEKYKSTYANRFKTFLFMGTNKPVKITDAKSGLLRRLIDVTPSGNKVSQKEYNILIKQITFELGAIAYHCKEVYLNSPMQYDNYIPMAMMGASNDFYNFMVDSYHIFSKEDGTTMKAAWAMYNTYCEEAKVTFPYSQRNFKEELKNYFHEYSDRFGTDDGKRVRSYFSGFRKEQFEDQKEEYLDITPANWIDFGTHDSIFDKISDNFLAQYASENGIPLQKWEKVQTTVSNLNTSKLHYVKLPEDHIVIDFDLTENGEKSLEKNLEAANKFPKTYAELSKSGKGIHLHYIYTGDPTKLSRIYAEHVEIKVFTGNSSLRRQLSQCNMLPIATIGSGLPIKKGEKVVNFEAVKNEKGLRTLIQKNLNKEIHPGTKPSIDFIFKILDDAYSEGLSYDVSDLRSKVLTFAVNSTNQADYCIKLVNKMQFKSDEVSTYVHSEYDKLVFFDVEIFPNLFIVCWKMEGEGKPIVRMINPRSIDLEELLNYNLVGFNNRKFDNHMLYAAWTGYSLEALYSLSQKLISDTPTYFGEAYSLSYTDIYDFSSEKKSLKKWEIALGIHHLELGLPWGEPVPPELWDKVAEYCCNDVIATETLFCHLKGDWTARQILADLAGMTVNDTTNTLTTHIIFGEERNPQRYFNYRDMSKPVHDLTEGMYQFLSEVAPEMMAMTHGDAGSLLPYFEGYTFEGGKSTYRGEEAGEGGYVHAEPGIYYNVPILDIVSMHPHSAIMEVVFGIEFTKRFKEIVDGRVSIKHKAWEEVNHMLDGKLTPYIQKVIDGEMSATELAYALKIAINSVYGLTAAHFDNAFRDNRNKDNIVAKRGALFMIDLLHVVREKGFTVAHIKTDSIKIPNATPELIDFVMDFGKKYGYTFEHEDTYEKMCLVNDAVYIAKTKDGTWTATGTQFAVPYVFKTLFSKEEVQFEDMCETKSVKSALYLDMNEYLDLPFDDQGYSRTEEAKQHDYRFIGKVGQFCPIKPGCGGGELLRVGQGDKMYAVTGTKGYRWLESEVVRELGKGADIDRSYYDHLVDEAVSTISKFGDFLAFVSDDVISNKIIMPCGDQKYETCFDCPNFDESSFDMRCGLGYEFPDCGLPFK